MTPLRGIRILDLTTIIAGPAATSILSRLGADVVKVERVAGEESRFMGTSVGDVSLMFETFNKGKRSIALDLASAAGRDILTKLIDVSDVFVHNLRPSAATRAKLDQQSVRIAHPNLIYCAISGYGTGLAKEWAGVDPAVQAFSGLMEMTGHADGPPTRCAASIIDLATAQWAALAIMAAIMDRKDRSFVEIDLALVDSAMALMSVQASTALLTGQRPARQGSGNPLATPHEVFEAQDRPIFVGAPTQAKWLQLVAALNATDLAEDPRFATLAARLQNRAALQEKLNLIFGSQPAAFWFDKLQGAAGIVIAEVLGVEEVVQHPLAQERSWFEQEGAFPVIRPPLMVNGLPLAASTPAPDIGGHSIEILREIGLSEAQIDQALTDAVVRAPRSAQPRSET